MVARASQPEEPCGIAFQRRDGSSRRSLWIAAAVSLRVTVPSGSYTHDRNRTSNTRAKNKRQIRHWRRGANSVHQSLTLLSRIASGLRVLPNRGVLAAVVSSQCRNMRRHGENAQGVGHCVCSARTHDSGAPTHDERLAARNSEERRAHGGNSHGSHQVARRCRSRNSDERVTRRERVHRGAACLAMLRGAMTALASPPPSPPKQPPPPAASSYPRAVSNPPSSRCPARSPDVPTDAAASTATTHPSLLLASFQPYAALQPPTVPRGRPSCLGPTNAILIGRKGGIQERKDLSRGPRSNRVLPRPALVGSSLFSRLFFRGFFSSSYNVPSARRNCFFARTLFG